MKMEVGRHISRVSDLLRIIREATWLLPRIVKDYYSIIVLRETKLLGLNLAISYRCQCRCRHCNTSNLYNSNERELTLKEIEQLIRDAKKLGILYLELTGGDPLLREDIYEIIRYARKLRIFTRITTNGLLLTSFNIRKLKEVEVGAIGVSIDTIFPHLHDRYRGIPGCFQRAIEGIENTRKAGICTFIDFVITHENIKSGEVWEIAKLAARKKVFVEWVMAVAMGRWIGKNEMLLDQEDQKIARKLFSLSHTRIDLNAGYLKLGCPSVKGKIYITAYGDVTPCTFIPISFGNIRKEPLIQIWKRMLSAEVFRKTNPLCLAAEDKEFIDRYMKPVIKNSRLPFPAKEHPAL